MLVPPDEVFHQVTMQGILSQPWQPPSQMLQELLPPGSGRAPGLLGEAG